jgi:thioredoxin-like negative regulator of GroEL
VSVLTMTVLLQVSILSTGAPAYSDAQKAALKDGEPLLVLVGANWCPACAQMKSAVVPELVHRGDLKNYHFAQVDVDQQRDLANRLSSAGVIPQLILYRKTEKGWRRWEIIGGQSPESVEAFLRNSGSEQAKQPSDKVTQR